MPQPAPSTPNATPAHDPEIEDGGGVSVTPAAPGEKINKGLFGDEEPAEKPAKKPAAKKAPEKPASKAKVPAENVQEEVGEEEPAEEPEEEATEDAEEGAQESDEAEEAEDAEKAEDEEDNAEPEDDNDFEVEAEMKVNGKAVKKTFTLQQLVRFAQKAHAADERFVEAKRYFEAAQAQAEALVQDPFQVLDRHFRAQFERGGHPKNVARQKAAELIRGLANQYLAPFIEEANLSEPERRLREVQRELEELTQERDRVAQENEQAEREAKKASQQQQLRRGVLQGFQSLGVNATEPLAQRAERRFWEYVDAGIQVAPVEAVREILQERNDYLNQYLETADTEELLRLRPDLGTKLRQTNLAKVKARQEAQLQGEDVPDTEADRPAPKKRKPKVFRDFSELERDAGPMR